MTGEVWRHNPVLERVIGMLGLRAYYELLERLDRDILILEVVRDRLREYHTQLNEANATESTASNSTLQHSPKKASSEQSERKRAEGGKQTEKCMTCNLPIETPEDKEFSESQENHPGVLGQIHIKCYQKVCDERPDTPWTDPISGEIDFEGMGDDLGVYPATEDQIAEEEGDERLY